MRRIRLLPWIVLMRSFACTAGGFGNRAVRAAFAAEDNDAPLMAGNDDVQPDHLEQQQRYPEAPPEHASEYNFSRCLLHATMEG